MMVHFGRTDHRGWLRLTTSGFDGKPINANAM